MAAQRPSPLLSRCAVADTLPPGETASRVSQLSTYEARLRARRAAERFRFTKKDDAPLRFCLAYANRYPVAMGNLGFQTVYELLDGADGVVCERAFLPDEADDAAVGRGALRTLESGRRITESDVLAPAISFET